MMVRSPLLRWQSWLVFLMAAYILLVALFAPLLAPPADPDHPAPVNRVGSRDDSIPHLPGPEAPLGTTPYQFDVFYSLIWGTREALRFGIGVTLVTAVLGTLLGALSAFKGGAVNDLFLRLTDASLAFPLIAAVPLMQIYFRAVYAAVFPPQLASTDPGMGTVSLALAEKIPFLIQLLYLVFRQFGFFTLAVILLAWIPYARLVNDQILRLKRTDFILAAQSLGTRRSRLIFRHLLPNAITPVIVWATRSIGALAILRTTFAFIGLGSSDTWATILTLGKDWIIGPGGNLLAQWWVYLPVTVTIVVFGFTWNLLGDELNIWLNPRER
jgi:peptide/nickel transport system permease protein